jgi:MFS family permease
VLARHTLPADRPEPCDRLDLRGFGLLSPGLAAIIYGLAQTANGAAASTLAPILAGAGLVGAFVVHALRAPNPLIDVRLLGRRAFAASAGTTFCVAMSLWGAMFLLPLYYQAGRGVSPLETALLLAPQGVGAAVAMPLAGRLTDRNGPGRVVLTGLTVMTLGTLPLAWAGPDSSFAVLACALLVRGLGLGATMMPAQTAAYATLGRDTGTARGTSALKAIQRMGGALGVTLMSVVLGANLNAHAAAAPAFGASFAWTVGLTLLAFVPAAFLPRRPVRTRRSGGLALARKEDAIGGHA